MEKICKNCGERFFIDEFDKNFYKQLKVPEPNFCPTCRLARRLSFMNLTTLHKRVCDNCGKTIFSMYPEDVEFPVFCPQCWWSNDWDPAEYALEYDPNKNIFEQFMELKKRVPHFSLQMDYQHTQNSSYVNGTGPVKDSYLVFNSTELDTAEYCRSVSDSRNVLDSASSSNIENSYAIFNSENIHSSSFVSNSQDCIDCHYSENLKNCQHCFACSHLSNKKYHIFNKEYSPQEYHEIVSQIKNGSYKNHLATQKHAKEFFKKFPLKDMEQKYTQNCTGEFIYESKDVFDSYEIVGGEKLKHCQFLGLPKIFNSMDYSFYGEDAENVYESLNVGTQVNSVKFSMHSFYKLLEVEYSFMLYNASFVFFSIGIKNGSYFILNKQYTEEEFYKLKQKIIQDMTQNPYKDSRGVVYPYGEFFPAELSDFGYNQTLASEYLPLTPSQAKELGFKWTQNQNKSVQAQISPEELPDLIHDTDHSIVGKTIKCLNAGKKPYCRGAFRITPTEFEFLRANNIPLPRKCPICRYHELTKSRPKLHLQKTTCACKGENSAGGYQNKYPHAHQSACNKQTQTGKLHLDRDIYCKDCYDEEFEI